jgi:hypothetical protein
LRSGFGTARQGRDHADGEDVSEHFWFSG